MIKKILAIGLTAVLATSMMACSSNSSDEKIGDKGTEKAADKKTFIVGFDAEYPPYGYMDENGEYTGFDLELAEKVCEMEGWTLEKKPINWDAKDSELNGGSIDCIWNGFTIDGRENDYEWTDAYCDNTQVVVVSLDSGIIKLSDLAGKVVGVQSASAAYNLLTGEGDQAELGATFGELKEFADYNTAFLDLEGNVVDAVAMDIGVANYQISSRGEGYVILSENLNTEKYGVGFKKGNTELRDIVNKDLHKLAEDGTVAKLAEKYEISDLICIK